MEFEVLGDGMVNRVYQGYFIFLKNVFGKTGSVFFATGRMDKKNTCFFCVLVSIFPNIFLSRQYHQPKNTRMGLVDCR